MDVATDGGARLIEGEHLASWSVLAGGTGARLEFAGTDGALNALALPFDMIASLLMTLPRILQSALNVRFPDGSLRYVHQLGTWRIEQAAADAGLILQLATPDGFEVAFTLNDREAASLGGALSAAPDQCRLETRRPN